MSDVHTSDHLSVSGTISSGNEDNIALAGVGVVVFQEEDLVDSVVLQSRELDE